MAFRLDFEEGLPAAVRRCLGEELGGAVERLEAAGERDRVEAVHAARRAIKKTRALVRLVSDAVDRGPVEREQRGLRRAGRALSDVRDADVVAPTVRGLAERFAGALPAVSFDAVADWVSAPGVPAAGASDGAPGESLVEVAGRLRAVVSASQAWRLRDDRALAAAGTARSYRAGRAALARVQRRQPNDAELHEWRKRVKELWYQQRLLAALWPRVLKAQSRELRALSELLGDDHDLVVLAERLRQGRPDQTSPIDLDAVGELITRRRAELLDDARRLGRRIYAERPRAFRRRIAAYLEAGPLAESPTPSSRPRSAASDAPEHAAIARRAYEIFRAGKDDQLANWLQAERELAAARAATSTSARDLATAPT